MAAQYVRFFSLLFVGLSLAPGLAHVLQLPHKMNLSGDDYLRVQQLYGGWALLGVVVFAALISTLLLTIMVRNRLRQIGLDPISMSLAESDAFVRSELTRWADMIRRAGLEKN